MALGDALRRGRAEYPDRPALVVDEQTWSYAQFDEITDRIGAALIRLGVRSGDRVALLFTNCPEIVFCYYACFKIGAIAVPVNFRLKGPEVEYILKHSGARLVIGQSDLVSEMAGVSDGLTAVDERVLAGDASALPGARPFEELLERPATGVTFPTVDEDAVAVILYTSGTTARPKGVTHTHATLGQQAAIMVACGDVRPEDILGIATPLCHASGFTCQLLPAMQVGATALIIPRPDPERVLRALDRHRATWFLGLPVLCNNLVHCPGSADLSALRVVVSGGDAVSPELQRRFQESFGVEITELWGMTEIVPGCMNPIAGKNKVGSIGLPAPGVRVRLVDAVRRDALPGEVGEMLVKSEAVTIGYWDDPEATAAALQDGWLRTGDLAREDEDGYYWFVGRKKELIIRGGSNISPLEVEEVLYQHPAVKEAGVVGVPDATWGEIVHAYVALKEGDSATEASLKGFLKERIADYKIPEAITLLPALPKGSTGKIHRQTLRAWAGTAGSRSAPPRELARR
jgi:long-chain acyl-CoA synthetase